jgi:aminomethyltransferase
VRKPIAGFVGAECLAKLEGDTSRPIRKGLRLSGKRIARQGDKVYQDGKEIGVVTSGTFGPTVGASIAMALVDPAAAQSPLAVEVDVRGKREGANWTPLPFYKRVKS